MSLIFRQFFDKQSSTYTYLIGDLTARIVVLIDVVREQVNRELELIKQLKFEKVYLLSTHIHADHITGNALIKQALNNQNVETILSKNYEKARADKYVGEQDKLQVGSINLNFLHTPGHTSGCMCIVDHPNKRVFTGDTLLIRGCGRTDFQGGSAANLYENVHSKLFTLPRDYLVYPAHDYNGRMASSIGEEIDFNPRLTKTKEEFVDLMSKLNLAYPKMIDVAVSANLNCGYEQASGDNPIVS